MNFFKIKERNESGKAKLLGKNETSTQKGLQVAMMELSLKAVLQMVAKGKGCEASQEGGGGNKGTQQGQKRNST